MILLVTILIHATSDEIAFADAPQYLYYIDNLFFFRGDDWFVFEPFSKINFIALRAMTGDTEKTVALSHYFISTVYLIGTLVIFPPRQANWRGLLMAFALYGSQLAFVTIRATPAYMFTGIAMMQAFRGRYVSLFYMVVAIMFHISAALALVPMAIVLAGSRIGDLRFIHNPRYLICLALLLGALAVVVGPAVVDVVKNVFQNIPFLGKYLVFAVGTSDTNGASIVESFAIGHFVLLAGITAFVFMFLVVPDPLLRRLSIFVLFSYGLYLFVFLAFSPVAAFRQTPFWVIPAFSIFPWERVGWRGPAHILFLALALGMFVFQFSRVI
ncbi:hypothetical protein SFC76_16550 [Sphingomonas sp. CD22]|uniref:hypothetical protein n=1 Tax=Sphingomonas sp. CD22 TaxID=3100214 RepID=UPI002AE05969|nr:hypothetical protein [Sphingomonas sp. CD22]MEA1085877.1 hypothetical protein [Sphingomonas sp. CD22]